MSEKIRDFLNELEQKDKNVDDITDINISIELNAERKRERN